MDSGIRSLKSETNCLTFTDYLSANFYSILLNKHIRELLSEPLGILSIGWFHYFSSSVSLNWIINPSILLTRSDGSAHTQLFLCLFTLSSSLVRPPSHGSLTIYVECYCWNRFQPSLNIFLAPILQFYPPSEHQARSAISSWESSTVFDWPKLDFLDIFLK